MKNFAGFIPEVLGMKTVIIYPALLPDLQMPRKNENSFLLLRICTNNVTLISDYPTFIHFLIVSSSVASINCPLPWFQARDGIDC